MLVSYFLKKFFLHRYDKDEAIPYYSVDDFKDMQFEEHVFNNSDNEQIHYFFYWYKGYKPNIVALFLPGMGPGHTAYFAEINALCKAGYKVLTLDYTGCGVSSGKTMNSIKAPTRDVNELLDLLQLKEEIVLVGHSLGGYTSLNIINIREEIKKAVVISGFLSIELEMSGFIKSKFIVKRIKKCEDKLLTKYKDIDNIKYLESTKDKIMYIQSTDDGMVAYKNALGIVKDIDNSNIECVTLENKKHNPTYTYDALKYMNQTFGEYEYLIKHKKLKTLEDRKEFMSDKEIGKMTEIDQELFKQIIDFIEC